MDADGGNVRLIANTKGRGTAPRWSPDGKKLVFISMLSGKNTDKVRDGEGTVTNTRGACAPQQDGKTIYFTNCVQKERTARMVRSEPQPLSDQ